ncbi:MAG: DUF58 domain-containing protein [Thermodesulfobacteriota bacterium]
MSIPGVTVDLGELVRLAGAVRSLRLGPGRRAAAVRAGGHLSVHKGRGLEFDEVRQYQAGDEVRSIDWRITARRGKPHTRLYREERERPIFVLADLNPGMFFGTRRQLKSVQVARLAAMAAWAALHHGDRVGGVVIGAEAFAVLPARARRHGVMALIQALVRLQPTAPGASRPGRLDEGLAKLRSLTRPGSLILLLSDFGEMESDGERLLGGLARHSDLVAGFVHDPLEAQPPAAGRFGFANLGRRLLLDTGQDEVQQRWAAAFRQRQQDLHALGQKSGFPVLDIATDMEPRQVLQQGLARLGRT